MENIEPYPLILVFYLDRELMSNPTIIKPFTESVNDILTKKNPNTIAFFLPTDGVERVECINPIMVKEVEMDKINKMIDDIKKTFSIGDEQLNNIDEDNQGKNCQCGPITGGCGENCTCENKENYE